MADTNNPKVTTRWRFTDEALSPGWRRLVAKLSANRKGKPLSNRQEGGDGECANGDGRNISQQ